MILRIVHSQAVVILERMQALARLDCHGNFSLLITYCDLRRLHLFCLQSPDMCNEYTIVSRKYSSPFASLALVQNAGGGGLYPGCDISLAITPSAWHEVIVGGE